MPDCEEDLDHTAKSAEAMVASPCQSSLDTDGAVDDLRPLVAARNSFLP